MGLRLTLEGLPGSDVNLRCKCDEVIIKSRGADEVIRAKVLIIKGNDVYAVCKRCNSEVKLPLKKSSSAAADFGPELYLDK